MSEVAPKTIFEYDNYRDFLADLYNQLKGHDKKFSFRYFSRIAGFQSPNFLKLVIQGKRNISPASIEKFAKALKLNKEETAFFRSLVLLNQAASVDEKQIYAEQLLKNRIFRRIHPLKESQFNYYAQWYFIPVRELAALKGFKDDPEWVSKQITPPITTAEARKALDELVRLGLLKRENGKLVQTDNMLATPDEVTSNSVAQYHREMLKKASESIDRFDRSQREISAVTVGLSEKNFKKAKELIQKFRRDMLQLVTDEQDADTVYQLNFQLFPLASTKKKD